MLDQVKLHLLSKVNGKVGQVFLILVWNDDILDMVSKSSKGLLFQASNWKDPAPQRDLAGHGHIFLHGNTRQGRNEGYGHGNTGRRSILGDRARRNMDMNFPVIQIIRSDSIGLTP